MSSPEDVADAQRVSSLGSGEPIGSHAAVASRHAEASAAECSIVHPHSPLDGVVQRLSAPPRLTTDEEAVSH